MGILQEIYDLFFHMQFNTGISITVHNFSQICIQELMTQHSALMLVHSIYDKKKPH